MIEIWYIQVAIDLLVDFWGVLPKLFCLFPPPRHVGCKFCFLAPKQVKKHGVFFFGADVIFSKKIPKPPTDLARGLGIKSLVFETVVENIPEPTDYDKKKSTKNKRFLHDHGAKELHIKPFLR